MPKLGQHFLRNPGAIKKIAVAAAPERGTAVIEIGPGHGELTHALSEQYTSIGTSIIALERDPALAAELRARALPSLTVVEGDARKLLAPTVAELKGSHYVIAGNIPYYLTGHLLRMIGELDHKPDRSVFTIQKEVAERITAAPPRMNRLAASIQFWATPKLLGILPKDDFSPPPDVDSAILLLETLRPESKTKPTAYYEALRKIFAQPRKTIFNNLRAGGQKDAANERLRTVLMEIGVLPESRPQDLGINDIESIAKALFSGDNRA